MNTLFRAALLLAAAGRIAAAQVERTAAGCVVDAVTKQPVRNVAVAVRGGSATTVTDSLGFFLLRGIRQVAERPGYGPSVSERDSVILIFTKSGLYAPNWEPVSVRARSPIRLFNVRLVRQPLGLLGAGSPATRSDTSSYARTHRPLWDAQYSACVAAVQKALQGT